MSADRPSDPSGLPRLIIETDLFADVDDVGAIALAVALERAGTATLAAVSVNTPSRFGPPAAAALLTALGHSAPVGRFREEDEGVYELDYARLLAERFDQGDVPVGPAVDVLRRALTDGADGQAVIVSIGFFANLVDLLASPPDAISDLDGEALVRAKVGRTVVMGGLFPEGLEFNLMQHPEDTRAFLDRWPLRVDFVGFETADTVITGRHFDARLGADHVISVAYTAYCGRGVGRPSWDPLTVYAAAFPDTELLEWSGPGELTVTEDGVGRWSDTPAARHRHAVRTAPAEAVAAELDRWLYSVAESTGPAVDPTATVADRA